MGKGEEIYPRLHLVISALCIPRRAPSRSCSGSTPEPATGDEKCTGTKLVRVHEELEQVMGSPRGTEAENNVWHNVYKFIFQII